MKVVVVVYDGNELPSDIITSMANQMSRFVVDESKIVIKQYNEEALLHMGVRKAVSSITFDEKNEAIDHACTYLSTRYGSFFKEPVKFVLAMSEVKNSGTNESTILKNAIQIISENPTDPILKKYSITPSVVKTIKEFKTSYHV